MRSLAVVLTLLTLAACTNGSAPAPTGPAGQTSASDTNPISGNRGGGGSK